MITGYFGLPRCGKTTFATKEAIKALNDIKRGKSSYRCVFTNFYCEGCYQIDYSNLGKYNYIECLIVLDEITLDADSREFKQFDAVKKYFFLMHGHYEIDIIYCTQQWDAVDKKIRDITYDLFYVQKLRLPFISNFSTATRIFRYLTIDKHTHQIVYGYRFPNLFDRLLGDTKKFCWRPKYYRFFDTHERKELPEPEYVEW